ncbi:MAG: hypothetical protein L0Y35_09790 [Flammeovirgaceae bacterium]|nr:hypothetical protein [Flammeovirgaceae bacterium]
MKELDDLKSIWKQKQPSFETKDADQIASMLKTKSTSIVSRLKKNVWFELIFTLVATVVIFAYSLTLPDGSLKWIFIFLMILFVAYIFYYVKKLTVLQQFDSSQGNLKETIQLLVHNLSVYLKFYRRSYSLLYPIGFIMVFILGIIERGLDNYLHALMQPRVLLAVIVVLVISLFCATWLTNWYLKKLYGNHLDKLREILRDLES